MFKTEWLLHAGLLISLLALTVINMPRVYAQEEVIPLEAEDLLKLLESEGVISSEQADRVRNISRERMTRDAQTSVDYPSEDKKDAPPDVEPGVTRVPYIPEYLKDEIRDEVRNDLKDEVVDDVLEHAKEESWGVPGAYPDWMKRIRFYGDIRFRSQGDFFADDNSAQYRDFNAINDAGGTAKAGEDAFFNTSVDRGRLRLRFRLGMNASVSDGVSVGMRLATGDPDNPVSTNQTLGGYGSRYTIALDRAYLRFNNSTKNHELTFGRMPNPWMTTQLIWDEDLNFDGLAYSYALSRGRELEDDQHRFHPFVTIGAFPLQEVELSSKDKWLFGAQTGFSFVSDNDSTFKLGLGYYHYDNISGVKNQPDSNDTDYTAPPFVQKGNTMFDISNSTTDPLEELWALAADYQELHLSAVYDIANFAPVHVILTGDYVKNIGFDKGKMLERAGATVDEKTKGYDIGINVGWPDALQPGNWNVGLNYRHLERDAVLDAFTDSDFHLGGTDGKGYKLAFRYGIVRSTWLQLRLISTNEIDGPPLGVMTVLADLNAQF